MRHGAPVNDFFAQLRKSFAWQENNERTEMLKGPSQATRQKEAIRYYGNKIQTPSLRFISEAWM
jgi:hypothetical protein